MQIFLHLIGIGLIRFIFATSVIIEHSSQGHPAFNFVNGIVAVQSFFMISGFYMAMILTTKYTSNLTFFINRILRIYPIYYAILGLSITFTIFVNLFFNSSGPGMYYVQYLNLKTLPVLSSVFLTNLTLIGQDFVMFLGIDIQEGSLFFTRNFRWSNPGLWNFLFVPQAWTLSLELVFYMIAPFLNKLKSYPLFLLLLSSLLLRFLLIQAGFTGDPWTYRFFPSELAFFIAGMLSFRIYDHLNKNKFEVLQNLASTVSIFILLFIILFSLIPIDYTIKRWGYYLIFAVSLPWVFHHSKSLQGDRKIGELSYPLYISHILILGIVQFMFPLELQTPLFVSVFVMSSSILFSLFLIKYIQIPIDQYRQQQVPITSKSSDIA